MNFLKSYVTSLSSPTQREEAPTPEVQYESNEVITTEPTNQPDDTDHDAGYFDWFQTVYSQSTEVWQQMKRDLSEVANAVAIEPRHAAEKTAASVRRHLSTVKQGLYEGVPPVADEPPNEEPIDEAELPDLRTTFTNFMSVLNKGLVTIATGGVQQADEEEGTWYLTPAEGGRIAKDKREAHLAILRADPETFDNIPPVQQDLLPYDDWRSVYFDEELCRPRPGVPLPNSDHVQPEHLDPAGVLSKSAIVRSHLLRLVDPDSHADGREPAPGTITEADFWSRYYYRVWLLDVAEVRRRRLLGDRIGTESAATISVAGIPTNATPSDETDDWQQTDLGTCLASDWGSNNWAEEVNPSNVNVPAELDPPSDLTADPKCDEAYQEQCVEVAVTELPVDESGDVILQLSPPSEPTMEQTEQGCGQTQVCAGVTVEIPAAVPAEQHLSDPNTREVSPAMSQYSQLVSLSSAVEELTFEAEAQSDSVVSASDSPVVVSTSKPTPVVAVGDVAASEATESILPPSDSAEDSDEWEDEFGVKLTEQDIANASAEIDDYLSGPMDHVKEDDWETWR